MQNRNSKNLILETVVINFRCIPQIPQKKLKFLNSISRYYSDPDKPWQRLPRSHGNTKQLFSCASRSSVRTNFKIDAVKLKFEGRQFLRVETADFPLSGGNSDDDPPLGWYQNASFLFSERYHPDSSKQYHRYKQEFLLSTPSCKNCFCSAFGLNKLLILYAANSIVKRINFRKLHFHSWRNVYIWEISWQSTHDLSYLYENLLNPWGIKTIK